MSLKLIFPRFCTWLACDTAILAFVKYIYPFVAAILLLHEKRISALNVCKNEFSMKEDTDATKPKRISKNSFFPRTNPQSSGSTKKDADVSKPTNELCPEVELKKRVLFWTQFWMVSAACQAIRLVFCALPVIGHLASRFHASTHQMLDQLELVFYLWLLFSPYVVPIIEGAPEGRPLRILAPVVSRSSESIYKSLNVFSDEWWERWVVRWTSMVLDGAVLVRALSKKNADAYKEFVLHGQSFLLPMASLMLPRFISMYGLIFVQFVVPVVYQDRNKEESDHPLCFWVIHAPFSFVVHQASLILWWVPLSRVAVFLFYFAMVNCPGAIRTFVDTMLTDLEICGVLEASSDSSYHRSVEHTVTAKAVGRLIAHLPKASSGEEGEKEEVIGQADKWISSQQEGSLEVLSSATQDDMGEDLTNRSSEGSSGEEPGVETEDYKGSSPESDMIPDMTAEKSDNAEKNKMLENELRKGARRSARCRRQPKSS